MECNTFCRTNVIGLVIAVFGAVIYVAGFFSPFWSFKATTDVSEGYKQFSEGIWMWCFKGERQAPIEDISVCKWYGVSAQRKYSSKQLNNVVNYTYSNNA